MISSLEARPASSPNENGIRLPNAQFGQQGLSQADQRLCISIQGHLKKEVDIQDR